MNKLLALILVAAAGCSTTTQTVSALDQDGCTSCHTNLTNAHTKAVVLCVNCHGQNQDPAAKSQLNDLISQFQADQPQQGDPEYQRLLDAMHVHPRQSNLFLANGESNDKGACFNGTVDHRCNGVDSDGGTQLTQLGDIDDAVDGEYARDLNYVRFINPGDLRVAQASCGGGNPQNGDYQGGCHAEEVFRVRRSIMTGNSSVVTAAYIGNRGQVGSPTETQGPFGDPRGYMFELDSVDGCFHDNFFDRTCLTQKHQQLPGDEMVTAMMPGNEDILTGQDVLPGAINAQLDGGVMIGAHNLLVNAQTLPHSGHNPRLGGIGGNTLPIPGLGTNEPRAQLKEPDNVPLTALIQFSLTPVGTSVNLPAAVCDIGSQLMAPLIEPVDGILRGFRAYYPLWLPGTGHNFNAVAGNTLASAATGIQPLNADPNSDTFAFNPFGRGHASGCSGCHMLYDNDGHNHEADQPNGDQTIRNAGREPHTDLIDGAKFESQGMNVEPDGTPNAEGPGEAPGHHKQQRFYPSRHRLTSRIPTRQCGLCHTFVTRIDLAYQGISEVEEKSTLARHDLDPAKFPGQGEIAWTTPLGTKVRIVDALERVVGDQKQAESTFRVTSDTTRNYKAYLAAVRAECTRRGIDFKNAAIYSADLNDNGELDVDEHFADDITGGELWLPDRVPRDESVDGRQVRIIYGGPNGSTQMKDVHFRLGMHCADCHFYQDVHGDGNIYTNNWEQIEIECEDCHGFANTRAQDVSPGQLLTSGVNGRNDLMQQRDEFGRPYFFVDGNGNLVQRSRLNPDQTWVVKQVADAMTMQVGSNPDANPHSDKHIAKAPGEAGKLECYSCHNTFAMNCLACHYQENFNQKAKQQQEVFLSNGLQSSHTNFQLFGMVRGPLILATNGNAENHRIAPFRSTMEAYVGVADCEGNQVANFITHNNCRKLDDGTAQIKSGASMNNFMPHSVRDDAVRGCETCHPATNSRGNVVNNHILAQTMGLGTGRLNVLGDWLFVASSGGTKPSALDVVDIKNESELGDTGPKNSFPGFVIGNQNDTGKPKPKALLRSFAYTNGVTGTPKDVVLVRSFNGNLCSQQESLLNPDLAVVAAGPGGVQLYDVSLPDERLAAGYVNKPFNVVPGNAVAIDHAGPDVGDPFFYVADETNGLEILDLSAVSYSPLELSVAAAQAVVGVPGKLALPNGLVPAGIKLMGTLVALTANASGQPPTLLLVDVSDPTSPQLISQTSLCGDMSCNFTAGRITSQGTIVYVASGGAPTGGLVAVDVSQPGTPKVLGSVTLPAPAEDVALSGHLAFVADGSAGLQIVDVTEPAAPALLSVSANLNGAIAHGVVIGAVPTQTWAFVAADTAGVLAVNVSTLFDPYRGRVGQGPPPISVDHLPLTLEARDPLSPRDTTVDNSQSPDASQLPVITFPTTGAAQRLARGIMIDRLVDESGRRLRDQWNPGEGVLSRETMDAMRSQSFPFMPAGPTSGNAKKPRPRS